MKVALLYPHILNLQGDFANYTVLQNLAKSAGVDFELTIINSGDNYHFDNFDVVLAASGEVAHFDYLRRELESHLVELQAFIESGKVLIASGTTQGLFGESILREDQTQVRGLGLLPLTAVERKLVYGDNIYASTNYMGEHFDLVGAQICMLDFNYKYSEKYRPFAQLHYGYGNSGDGSEEGMLLNNSIFTGVHGPLLVVNPDLAWKLINYFEPQTRELPRPDFSYEFRNRQGSISYTKRKTSQLDQSKLYKP